MRKSFLFGALLFSLIIAFSTQAFATEFDCPRELWLTAGEVIENSAPEAETKFVGQIADKETYFEKIGNGKLVCHYKSKEARGIKIIISYGNKVKIIGKDQTDGYQKNFYFESLLDEYFLYEGTMYVEKPSFSHTAYIFDDDGYSFGQNSGWIDYEAGVTIFSDLVFTF